MRNLFSGFFPGDSTVHRLPLAAKYVIMLATTGVAMFSGSTWAAGSAFVVAAAVLIVARLPLRSALGLPWIFLMLIAGMVAYHVWYRQLDIALITAFTWITAIYGSRIITMTTPTPALLDGLDWALRPLARVGINTDAVSLAIALMLRSVPYLFDSFTTVRDAARARGLERSLWAQIAPVVVGAVAYAQRTGEAIVARDLLSETGESAK